LSHSSIVAREYGIPAVLGTGVATRRIVDGQTVLVDGDAGSVTLVGDGHNDEPAALSAAHAATSRRLPRARTIALAAASAAVITWLIRRMRR
jgi:pyruvate,water dikinase